MKLLRQYNPAAPVVVLCSLLGKSRQAYYERLKQQDGQRLSEEIILQLVEKCRAEMPGIGTRKLLHDLAPRLLEHRISIGRDSLFELLRSHNLLVRPRRRSSKTTYSLHRFHKYPNLMGAIAGGCTPVVGQRHHLYYSSRRVQLLEPGDRCLLAQDRGLPPAHGLTCSRPCEGTGNGTGTAAEEQTQADSPLRRGFQYCCDQYVELLDSHVIQISMTNNGDPYENAIAERVNGILKMEFGVDARFADHEQAQKAVERAVKIYNERRPHASCDYLTPAEAHKRKGVLNKRWKDYPKSSKRGVKQVQD